MVCTAAPSGYDGIGRHARFRFLCREACGFESHYPHDVICRYGYSVIYCRDCFGNEESGWRIGMKYNIHYDMASIILTAVILIHYYHRETIKQP